jgi:dihydrofolate synthase/folylpolyglutamate synthase
MPYEQTLQWLYTLEAAKGMDFKLERVALALDHLGSPQRQFTAVHIAGTNGKGSVAAMIHAVLTAAGYRTGLYISPHLVRFTERVRVGDDEIDPTDIVTLTAEIQRAATSRGIELTFFEFVTVMAFLHFARRGVEIAVVEVGLGGRLDATNVIDPALSIITTIDRDHTQYLGRTLAAIAAEKGGIIKTGRPVVLGHVGRVARTVLRHLAANRGAPAFEAGRDFAITDDATPTFRGLGWTLANLTLALRGSYQRENAATALAAVAVLHDRFPVGEAAIRKGLATVRWPGRLEIVGDAPLVILDGAHNPAGVRRLLTELAPLLGDRDLHVLFAVMRDKPWRAMIDRLGPRCRSVVACEVQPPRGLPAARAARRFARHCPAEVEADPRRALAALRARLTPDDAGLVTGSLFLIGAVYPMCRRDTGIAAEAPIHQP